MHNVLWDTHTISPVLHKLCKLVHVSRTCSHWGVWAHAITWYCHILTAEPHFSFRDRKHTHWHTQSISTLLVQKFICKKNGKWAQVHKDLCFICWITLHQLKFFRSVITKKKLTWWNKSLHTVIFWTWVTFASDQFFDKLSDTNVQLTK